MSEPMRVLIADDELTARRRLQRLLAAFPDVVVAGECATGEEVLTRARASAEGREPPIHVVLLDVQMPGLLGTEALQLWPQTGPLVIFCTAHPDHAVFAFDAGAVDYVLKPVEPARLRKALDRARTREAQQRFDQELHRHQEAPEKTDTEPPSTKHTPLARLAVPTRQGIVLLEPASISHAVLEGELVSIHSAEGTFLCDLSMQELEERLPADSFERVHRRALLNLEHVVRLEPLETGGFLARTRSGHTVEVSRQSARELRRRLGLRPGR